VELDFTGRLTRHPDRAAALDELAAVPDAIG
jgi:hypothetical protein